MGGAARCRRRELPHAACVPPRPVGVLPREARGRRDHDGDGGRWPRGHRAAPAHRQRRAQGDLHAGKPDRHASLRGAIRDLADLLDERHDRDAELRPAHCRRCRELGHGIRAQLRGFGNSAGPAHRVHLQRGPVRRRRGAGVVRAHRPLPRPRRHREHRATRPLDRAPAARGGRAHAVVRRASRRVVGGAGDRSPPVERRAGARRRRAWRRRAGDSARSSRRAGVRR